MEVRHCIFRCVLWILRGLRKSTVRRELRVSADESDADVNFGGAAFGFIARDARIGLQLRGFERLENAASRSHPSVGGFRDLFSLKARDPPPWVVPMWARL